MRERKKKVEKEKKGLLRAEGKGMDYKEFREILLEELRRFYGDSAEVETTNVPKNNGGHYDGIQVKVKGDSSRVAPVLSIEGFYNRFTKNGMDMEDCVQAVSRIFTNNSVPEGVEQVADKIKSWDYVKENVFPILLSTKDNRELLQKLASTQMLDLSVAYIIRVQMADDCMCNTKVNKNMLEGYGITTEQIHDQAMENLRRDGYEFQNMESIIRDMVGPDVAEEMHRCTMHVLTNSSKIYGAAGILDGELLKEFAGEQDYYILPASIHETIFVPVIDEFNKEELDCMVATINATQVIPEERLTNHSYYYDAGACEIRMCA